MSEKHAGFIINRGGATAVDMIALICRIQDIVEKAYGYRLICKIHLLTDGEERKVANIEGN